MDELFKSITIPLSKTGTFLFKDFDPSGKIINIVGTLKSNCSNGPLDRVDIRFNNQSEYLECTICSTQVLSTFNFEFDRSSKLCTSLSEIEDNYDNISQHNSRGSWNNNELITSVTISPHNGSGFVEGSVLTLQIF